MKKALKVVGALLLTLVLVASGVYGWASFKTRSLLGRHFALHQAAFPVPFPLSSEEVALLRKDGARFATNGGGVRAPADLDLDAIALQAAIARGSHLVASRYACTECHGKDFGGGTMIDAAPIGRLFGPNITLGRGSRTLQYTASDWDHIVRHGVKPDGTPSAMPAQDFQRMSDEELSDIVAYVRSQPPVDAEIPGPVHGPLGKLLVAIGKIPLAADLIDHGETHPPLPPETTASVQFGAHLAGTCVGCHGHDLSGGPIRGGDPSWPPAANLTPDATGLAGWSYEDFVKVVTTDRKRDGSELRAPMSSVVRYAQQMTDTELRALWMFLQAVPPKATGA